MAAPFDRVAESFDGPGPAAGPVGDGSDVDAWQIPRTCHNVDARRRAG
ncbi:hypothetical protein BV133_735 [Blastochloris viridis]|uniref:Uncharacterized protein n=1 Tax=Blastochloris viridis TaxID=1079 RepID=A0A182CZ24_BLAVI|nr:hypothetical protein BV133_735 [Blastochloris viridis]